LAVRPRMNTDAASNQTSCVDVPKKDQQGQPWAAMLERAGGGEVTVRRIDSLADVMGPRNSGTLTTATPLVVGWGVVRSKTLRI